MRSARLVPLLLLLAFAAGVTPSRAQSLEAPGEVRLAGVTLEPQEPAFGEAFEARVALRIAPGVELALSDTVHPAEAVTSVGPAEWSTAPGPGDSLDVTIRYPLVAFREGRVEMPRVPLWTAPAPGGVARVRRVAVVAAEAAEAPGAGAGDSGGGEPRAGDSGSADGGGPSPRYSVHLGSLVLPHFAPLDEPGAVAVARGPSDVLGGEWSLWLFLALGVASVVGVGGLGAAASGGWGRWGGGLVARLRGRTPRQDALRELERARAEGWHRNGRVDDFYAASTDAVRTFAMRQDPGLAVALTTTELVERLRERKGSGVDQIAPAMTRAERVKFGSEKPDAAAAERDWSVLREWVRAARLDR